MVKPPRHAQHEHTLTCVYMDKTSSIIKSQHQHSHDPLKCTHEKSSFIEILRMAWPHLSHGVKEHTQRQQQQQQKTHIINDEKKGSIFPDILTGVRDAQGSHGTGFRFLPPGRLLLTATPFPTRLISYLKFPFPRATPQDPHMNSSRETAIPPPPNICIA